MALKQNKEHPIEEKQYFDFRDEALYYKGQKVSGVPLNLHGVENFSEVIKTNA